jgi:transcriptional regulator MraZ
VARFFGRYEHSLDVKGRLILPSKFRVDFERGGYLTQFFDGCLALFTPERFNLQMDEMQSNAEQGGEARNLARVVASGSHEVDVDKQGRMFIPVHLRDFAGLVGDVLVNGAIDRVELWNPEVWEAKLRPVERQLNEGVTDSTG